MRFLHKWLFGYYPLSKNVVPGQYWDWTTLILRRTLRRYLKPDDAFLDMGTGPVGVLAIFAALKLGCKRISAIDKLEQIVMSARLNAESVGAIIDYQCSDLFDCVQGTYDVISFNAPYLDIEKGRQSRILIDELSELRFSGGIGGGEVIDRFLRDAPHFMSKKGILLLGVNHYHIPRKTVLAIIARSGWISCECIESLLIPASAYLLRRTDVKEHTYENTTRQ